MTIALITGGASGIGAGCAEVFAAAGVEVVLADIDYEGAQRVAARLADQGSAVYPRQLDVTSARSWDEMRKWVEAEIGSVDWLVNNAGIMGPMMTDFEFVTMEQWRRVLAINLDGAVWGLQTFLPSMKARGTGHIVNTGSIASVVSSPRNGPYTASKFAVGGLTRGLRKELEPLGIGVSLLCPGFVNTSLLTTTARNAPELATAIEGNQRIKDVAAMLEQGLAPLDVGRTVLAGIRANRENIFTHPSDRTGLEAPGAAVLEDLDWLDSYWAGRTAGIG